MNPLSTSSAILTQEKNPSLSGQKTVKKRSRLDISLISPSLIASVTSMDHLAHPYTVTDHSSLMMKLLFMQTIQGEATFRCPVGIHNDPAYHRLAANSIKSTIINAVEESGKKQTYAVTA